MFTYTTEPNVNIHDKVSKRVHLTRCDKTTGKNQNIQVTHGKKLNHDKCTHIKLEIYNKT